MAKPDKLPVQNDAAAKPALAERATPARTVISVIAVRLVIEIFLGTFTKAVYKLQPNPATNLVCTNIFMALMCIILHLVNKMFPFMPSAFGGKWSPIQWNAIVGLLIPTVCLCGSILLKQNIIKNSGPGYAEMIAGVGVPVSAIIQYFVNGVTIGWLGIASCVVAFGCYAACFPVCGWVELVGGLGAASLNVTRASMTKKSNKNFKLPAGLNLLYTCMIGLPFYFVMVFVGDYWLYKDQITDTYNWTNLFYFLGPIPIAPVPEFGIQLFLAFCSNIVVFVLYDIASPLTYVISAGLKGIIQTFFDIFYIDYYIVLGMKALLPNSNLDPERYKNKHKMSTMGIVAFSMKLLYFFLYVTEKIITKRKKDKLAKLETAKKDAEAASSSSTSSDDSDAGVKAEK